MAIEIEKKYILSNEHRERIIEDLREFGASYVGEEFEENSIYSGGILSEKNAVLRIRKINDRNILTYKERLQSISNVKHQIEYETIVENADELEKIIQSIGFSKVLVYEKYRQTWRFRTVEIVLDKLPFGEYLEIEGSITSITEAEMILGMEDFVVEHETYPRLTNKFGAVKENITEARF